MRTQKKTKKEINDGKHGIYHKYGAFQPTAIFVPLKEMVASDERFHLVTSEVLEL
jgi:1-pyrroline-5-carboxylate dehydrogenase